MSFHPHWRAAGCPACGGSGYRGRRGVYELLRVDESLRALIHQRQAETALRQAARANGMRSLREDAGRWLEAGKTSLEEVLRVVGEGTVDS